MAVTDFNHEPEVLIQKLLEHANSDEKYRQVLSQIGEKPVNISGLADVQKAYIIQALSQSLHTPFTAVVMPDIVAARHMADQLRALSSDASDVLVWRSRDYAWTMMEASSLDIEQSRLGILHRLNRLGKEDGDQRLTLVIAGQSLLQLIPPSATIERLTTVIDDSFTEGPEGLAARLTEAGYERVMKAEVPGQFARRGDIVDVIPVGLPENQFGSGKGIGYRTSFFDTDVDLIRKYDIATQRSIENIIAVRIPPAREVNLTEEEASSLSERIRKYHSKTELEMKQNRVPTKTVRRFRQLCEQDADAVSARARFPGLDRWLNWIYSNDQRTTILDYIKDFSPLLFVDEPARLRERLDGYAAETIGQIRSEAERGQTLPDAVQNIEKSTRPFITIGRWERVVSLAAIASSGNGLPGGTTHSIQGRDTESFRGRETLLTATIAKRNEVAAKTAIAVVSEERQKKLLDLFRENGVTATLIPTDLERGFEYPGCGLLVLGRQDIFGTGRRRSRRRRKSNTQMIDLFSDLTPGDRVVHEVYGIGRYDGLVNLENDGYKKDYLKISYAGDDVLYLPMKALDLLQKYIGTSSRKPKLSRLGGNEWERLKERARTSIRKLATDLVALYAKRSRIKGYVFGETTPWERAFADSFPFEETADQLQAIKEIEQDMESPKVMDRLLCGDVGFGKTEVAFRAIFKCVMNGKQAAMIAPTTVLASQHYETFKQRIGDFPVRVGLLSRFTSPAETKTIVGGLKRGSVDVVIGTHRILSKDVTFSDLGLLIIDEEQRFGVDHKEKLKNINPSVDVLTLSATPIPRTLHMSLSGIRDISILEEPPQDRRAVQTYVMEYDEEIILGGIQRELEREGQVFYLFNDTRKIYDKAEKLREQLPMARIMEVHGKMNETQLEAVIDSFIKGEIDILVCTTIIESGIDMPNVNTIIVEKADKMGLAQLYQLRGRVGRSTRQAYAYITYQKDKVLNEDAEKRLVAIRNYTQLGAGFQIALKDLEVRGAGNLLGGEQHGQLDAVGYDLYNRMLDEEIQRVKRIEKRKSSDGEEVTEDVPLIAGELDEVAEQDGQLDGRKIYGTPDGKPLETIFDVHLDAYISADYIPDDGERIDIYRRIAMIRNAFDYHDTIDELTDRYGDLPIAVQTLADVAYVKAQANRWGYDRVFSRGNNAVLTLGRQLPEDMELIAILMSLPDYRDKTIFHATGKQPYLEVRGLGGSERKLPQTLCRMFMAVEKEEKKSQH
ncbi:MAG: transcription-repair coupling factor [Fastidiosipilaceae bacterium]